MSLFNGPEEYKRKANLKKLEDKRVALAQRLAREGFAPERMLFAQTQNGGFAAISRFNGRLWLIISPGFGTDEEYVVEQYDAPDYTRQQVHVKGEGMGGIFGFGKKSEIGVEYVIRRADGGEARLPFVVGRNCWLDSTLPKNPLLKTQRRRGDANIVWDFKPLDYGAVERASRLAEAFLEGE